MNKFVEWLSDNWIGGVIGGILGLIISYFNIWAMFLHMNFSFLHWFILGSPRCSGLVCPTLYFPNYAFPQGFLLLIIIGALIGAFIYSLFRRIK